MVHSGRDVGMFPARRRQGLGSLAMEPVEVGSPCCRGSVHKVPKVPKVPKAPKVPRDPDAESRDPDAESRDPDAEIPLQIRRLIDGAAKAAETK